jgi:membrane fusion protein, heavy metal efflux system
MVDVLAPELLEAAASYVTSAQRLEFHQARAQELESLRTEGLVDKARVFEQRALAAELAAQRAAALATLRGAGIGEATAESLTRKGTLTLRAPVAGIVTELDARPGEMRDVGSAPFARIRGEGAARIEVRTPARWSGGDSVQLELISGETFELQPAPIASVVEPEAGTFVHWFLPKTPVALADGLRGVIRLQMKTGVWEVPAGAVLQKGATSTVIRRRAGRVAVIPVEVLASSGASALVTGELQAKDDVAADAARSEPLEATR